MGMAEELRRQGYELEYEYDRDGDHIEVWTSARAGMGVRIQWMRMEKPQS